MAVIPVRRGSAARLLEANKIRYRTVFYAWWMAPSYWSRAARGLFRALYLVSSGPAARRTAAIARRFGAVIIHSNSSVIDVGARAAAIAQIKHIWHFREFGDSDFRLTFQGGKAGREKAIQSINRTDGRVIYVSEAVHRRYAGEIREEIGTVIYNGISADYLMSRKPSKEREPIVFLIAGTLQRGKNQMLAIDAMRRLHDRGYDHIKLLIAGAAADVADSRRYERELRNAASGLPEGMIVFCGEVEDMNRLRSKADAELVCSVSEAFGRCAVEAMMASNPVIASDAGANPELIVPEFTGLLFEAGSAESLASSMESLLKNPEKTGELGRNAHLYAEENFLSLRNTEQVERVYEALLTGAGLQTGSRRVHEHQQID